MSERICQMYNVSCITCTCSYVSVNSNPDDPTPQVTPGDLHILVAPGVGFNNREKCLGGEVLARFYRPEGWGF